MKFPLDLLQNCWFLAGPTAVGKTALGILLAQRIGGELVSLDSMSIYRKMNIGTAKPSAAEQSRVPHHLIDIVDPHEEFSTDQYMREAIIACKEIVERGHVPIFVGGTGLYLRSILRGVFEGPEADWKFREDLEQQATQEAPGWLSQRLEQIDPQTAERIHPNDTRRLIRALEIHHLTGKTASDLLDEGPLPKESHPQHVYWLFPERDWIHERINVRVDQMIAAGLEEEVRMLLQLEPPIGRTARQGLGYREMIDWIEGRSPSIEKTAELIKTHTRQFAKRQHTWFRNLEECQAINVQPSDTVQALADRVVG